MTNLSRRKAKDVLEPISEAGEGKGIKVNGRELTIKQRKWLKVYFETGNATKASLEAYDTTDRKSAGIIGVENLAKLRDVVSAIMEAKGLDIQHMVKTVYEATEATKRVRDFETGDIDYDPDHPTRLKAVEIASRWVGIDRMSEGQEASGNIKKQIVATEFFERGRD